MITGELKNRIDSLWDDFAAGGIVNPLTVIEQITYLMFIHDLDEADNKGSMEAMMLGISHESIFKDKVEVEGRTVDGKQLKWSVFQDFPAEKMFDVVKNEVFPFIINLHSDRESAYSKYMSDAIFMIPTPLLLSKVVEKLSDLFRMMKETKLDKEDVRGDVYEYLLSKLNTAGRNGQFRTPRHIIKMMVELMQPKPDEIICDPACGTSGFLIAASEYLMEDEERKREVLFDKENKEHYLNHMFHGYDPPKIKVHHTDFEDEILEMKWDGGELENDYLKDYRHDAEVYIRQHPDHLVIGKLKSNIPLTKMDVEQLEQILWSEVGSKEDYEKEYGDKPLGELVREIVGMDMNAAKAAFADYLENANLNDRQIYFVNQIVEYIVRNGIMKDVSVLQDSPFTDRGNIIELFGDSQDVWSGIMGTIRDINRNADIS